MIHYKSISLKEHNLLIEKILDFFELGERHVLLNSNPGDYPDSKYSFLWAWGAAHEYTVDQGDKNSLSQLRQFYLDHKTWIFGHVAYDFKNALEKLESTNPNPIGFPELSFFSPKVLIIGKSEMVEIYYQNTSSTLLDKFLLDWEKGQKSAQDDAESYCSNNVAQRFSQQEYGKAVQALQQEIQRGNIYEVNFCQEFFCNNFKASAHQLYQRLNHISPTPFSALYSMEQKHLICASPERYLKKDGELVLSQPIKGTAPRGKTPEEDLKFKQALLSTEKERAENVMIVDLVRNDLAQTAQKGSVVVKELFGLYTYPQVHQMISTIQSKLLPEKDIFDVLESSFPMGSMTGAPKVMAMQLIDRFERTARGLYSGTIGYIDPEGNADFNVIIRSLQYNEKNHYLSFFTGGAITILSHWEEEYKECLLKAQGIMESLHEE
jgi:para-aminobenzoate synthetase component 1